MVFDEEGEHGGFGLVVVVAQHHDVGIVAENAQRVFVVGLFALPNPRPSELILPINQPKERKKARACGERGPIGWLPRCSACRLLRAPSTPACIYASLPFPAPTDASTRPRRRSSRRRAGWAFR